MRARPFFFALLALAFLALFPGQADPAAKDVTFKTRDGVTIFATYFEPEKPGRRPSVILLHMLNRTRADWSAFARRLAREGYAVLALDLRGHGQSLEGAGPWMGFSPDQFRAMVEDVASAHRFLRDAPRADAGRLALIGASIGANVALQYGSRSLEVKTLVLLSPGLNYRGVTTEDAVGPWGKRPLLIVASREDRYSAQSSRRLDRLAQGRHRLILFDRAGHGTRMFEKVPGLEKTLLEWLASNL